MSSFSIFTLVSIILLSTQSPDDAQSSPPLSKNEPQQSDSPPKPNDAQYASDVTVMDGIKPLLPFQTSPTSWQPFQVQPAPIGQQDSDPAFGDPLEPLLRPIRNTQLWTRHLYIAILGFPSRCRGRHRRCAFEEWPPLHHLVSGSVLVPKLFHSFYVWSCPVNCI